MIESGTCWKGVEGEQNKAKEGFHADVVGVRVESGRWTGISRLEQESLEQIQNCMILQIATSTMPERSLS
jgi:hypothetical protein